MNLQNGLPRAAIRGALQLCDRASPPPTDWRPCAWHNRRDHSMDRNRYDMTEFTPDTRPPSRQKRVSLVIPMFNEAEALHALFARLDTVLPDLTHYQFEIVCINDGSTDDTLALLQQQTATRPDVTLVDLSRNFGKEAALSAGLFVANGDAVIPLDADLQDPPEVIKDLLAKWEEGFEVVLARRSDRSADYAAKRFTAQSFYRIHNAVADVEIPPDVGDFRLMDRVVIDALNALPEGRRFMKGLFAWVGFRTATIEYRRESRVAGTSKFNAWKLWNFALEGIASFSISPLKVWTYIGVFVALAAMGWGGWIALRTIIWGVDLPGYASILVAVLLLGGLQLTGIGMIGEYLGRAFMESKRRPAYLIRQVVRSDDLPQRAGIVTPLPRPQVTTPIKPNAAPRPPSAVAQFFTRNAALVNHSSLSRAALGFLLVAILVQWPVLFSVGYFSHDELQWLSFAQRPWGELFDIVSFADIRQFQYRPLTFDVWLVVSKIFGESPVMMHVVRGGFGVIAGGLLALLIHRLGASKLQAITGGLLFLLTPIAAYTNSWIGTYADALCLLFLLAIALSLTRRVPLPTAVNALLALVVTALALLSKESAVVFPALLMLGWLIRRERAILIAAIASGVAVAIYIAFRADVILFPAVPSGSYAWKITNIPARMVEYALFPFSLNRFETLWQPELPMAWLAVGACLIVVGVVAKLGWRWIAALVLGFYGALGPVLILAFLANHYANLASAFACALLALAWRHMGNGYRVLLIVPVLVVTIHGVQMMRTMYRVGEVQSVLFAELARILPTTTGVVAVRAANEKDNFIVDRLLHQVPEYRGIKMMGRVTAAQASARPGEITHRMQRDGRLTPSVQ